MLMSATQLATLALDAPNWTLNSASTVAPALGGVVK